MFTLNFVVSKKEFCKVLERYKCFYNEKRFYFWQCLFNYFEVNKSIVISTAYLFNEKHDFILEKYYSIIDTLFNLKKQDIICLKIEG